MLIISYDIKSNKLRTKFNKYIKKYGYRLQFSVYKIRNSERILEIIKVEIENNFSKDFSDEDTIMIFDIKNESNIIKYGYARHEDNELLIIT